MKVFFILFSVLIFSANTKAACPNVVEIHRQSLELEKNFTDLIEVINTEFPRRYNLYEFTVRAESDVRFISFSTQSGAMPCTMTINSFIGLERSFHVLKNHIARFQNRRPKLYKIYQREWESLLENYRILKTLVEKN